MNKEENNKKHVHYLQYIWYELDCAKAFLRMKEWGKGLR